MLQNRRVFLFLLGLIILTLLFYLWSNHALGTYDESIISTGALRVLEGEWPGRDFYANYGPLQFALVAGLYDMFGPSVAIGRLYDAFLNAGAVMAVVTCLWVAGLHRAIPVAICGCTIYQVFASSPLYPLTPVTLLLLIGAVLLIRNLTRETGLASYIPLGIVYALSIAYRFDFAIVSGAAFGLAVLAVAFDDVVREGRPVKEVLSNILGIGAILTGAAVALLAFLWGVGLLAPALDVILTHNAGNYADMRALPYPPIGQILTSPLYVSLMYLPFVALAFAAIVSLWLWRRLSRAHRVAIIVLVSATACGLLPAIVRSDLPHLYTAALCGMALLCAVYGIVDARLRVGFGKTRWFAATRIGVLGFSVLAALFPAGLKLPPLDSLAQRLDPGLLFTGGQPSTVSTRLGAFTITPEELELIQFMDDNMAPGERFVSVNGRHDRVFINNMRVYFAAGRLPGTFFHHFDPGVQTRQDVQAEIIQDLEDNDIRVLFEDRRWDHVEEDNLSALSSGVLNLDTYIKDHFTEALRIGNQAVLLRN